MESPRSTNEVRVSSVIENNGIAIGKVSKKIETLTRLVFLIIILNILGWVGVLTLIIFKVYL